jgi:hypothetical protein
LQEDSAYRIEQVKKKSKTNSVDALLNIIDYQIISITEPNGNNYGIPV